MTLLSLGRDEVCVWSAAPASIPSERWPELMALLDAEERRRAQERRIETDREGFVLAHALVRLALSCCAAVEPRAWSFVPEEGGRPVIAEPREARELRFSLSHARGRVACAVARDREVGVDVEDLTRRELDGEEVGRHCFADGEREAIEALAPGLRSEQRLALFTLKEAYSKARGMGLGLDFTRAVFALDPPALLSAPGDDARRWLIAQRRLEPAHVLAVASSREPNEIPSIRFFEGLPALG